VRPPLYTNDRKFLLPWSKKMAASRLQEEDGRTEERIEIERREEEKEEYYLHVYSAGLATLSERR